MAQSPASLQEPSMDELLASIREIIEESSAASEAAEFSLADSENLHPENKIVPDVAHENPAHTTQEDSLANAAIPIHDAMKALAARIGLKKQSEPQPSTTKEETGQADPSVSPPAASPAAIPIVPQASAPQAIPSSPVPPATGAPVINPFPFARMNVSKTKNKTIREEKAKASLQPLPQMSLSATIPAPTTAAPAAKISPTPQNKTQNKTPLVAGHVPLYPQLRTLPQPQQAQAPSQGSASAELGAHPPAPATAPEAPLSTQTSHSPQEPESKKALSDLEKGFLAEFEQSAELLLRPYIAGWLEEHFHHLFEKILREEIQRLMQKNMRR